MSVGVGQTRDHTNRILYSVYVTGRNVLKLTPRQWVIFHEKKSKNLSKC